MSWLRSISVEPVVLIYVLAIFAEYDVIGDIFFVNKCIDQIHLNHTNQLHNCTVELKTHKNNEITKIISKEANKAQQWYNGILYATSILSSFVAATYADRRSKFLPIILAILGSATVQILILSSLLIKTNELPFLFSQNGLSIIYLCSFVSGITGGTSTLLSSCFAHVAEICNQSHRTARITIIEACLFGGGFFGFTIAGSILRKHPNSFLRYEINFAMFLVAHISMAIYVFVRRAMFLKPNGGNQSQMTLKLLLTSIFKNINRRRAYRNHRLVVYLILLSFTIISYWNVSITTMLFMYTRSLLSWPTWKYSYFSSAKFGICGIFLCLLPVVQYALASGRIQIGNSFNRPIKDGHIITIGLISRGLTTIFIALASLLEPKGSKSQDIFMVIALASIIFAEYPIPAIRSLISKVVEPNEKAQMFTVMAAIQSICFFTGGIGFLSSFNALLDHGGPGWIFIVMAILQFIALMILCYVQYLLRDSNNEQLSLSNDNHRGQRIDNENSSN